MQPKQFWTKLLKVVLVLYIIGGFVYSIILTATLGGNFWWIVPVGWILTFLSASGIGTIVEISENTAAHLETERNSNSPIPNIQQQAKNTLTDTVAPNFPKPPYTVSANVNSAPEINNKRWSCSKCGEVNDGGALHCVSCGNHK